MVYYYRFRWENYDCSTDVILISEKKFTKKAFCHLCTELLKEATREALESDNYITDWLLSEAVVEKLKQRGFVPLKCDVEFCTFGFPDESSKDFAETYGLEDIHISTVLGEELTSLVRQHNEELVRGHSR